MYNPLFRLNHFTVIMNIDIIATHNRLKKALILVKQYKTCTDNKYLLYIIYIFLIIQLD